MNTFSIRESIKVGWAKFMARPWYLLGISLAFGILFVLASNNAAVAALGSIVYAGYLALILKQYRTGSVQFDDLFSIVDARWIYLAFAILIKSLLILLGLVLLVVPGIYLALRWSFVELLIVDKGMKPMEAFRASTEMTKGHKWHLLGYVVVSILLILVGLVAVLVGALVAGCVLTFAFVHIYEKLKESPSVVVPQ